MIQKNKGRRCDTTRTIRTAPLSCFWIHIELSLSQKRVEYFTVRRLKVVEHITKDVHGVFKRHFALERTDLCCLVGVGKLLESKDFSFYFIKTVCNRVSFAYRFNQPFDFFFSVLVGKNCCAVWFFISAQRVGYLLRRVNCIQLALCKLGLCSQRRHTLYVGTLSLLERKFRDTAECFCKRNLFTFFSNR